MTATSARRAALSCALLATTAFCGLSAAPAAAQTHAPVYRNLDANGVDLVRGDFVTSFPEGSIGSDEAELVLLRMVGNIGNAGSRGSSQWDNILLQVTPNGTAFVDFGARSDTFPGAESRGVALTATSAGSYEYRAADGSVIEFTDPSGSGSASSNFCNGSEGQGTCMLLPSKIRSPDGKSVTLEYESWPFCSDRRHPDDPFNCTYDTRLHAVFNSFGYRVEFSYASGSGTGAASAPASFYRRTGASFYGSRGGTTPLAQVSYSYPAAGVTLIADMGGRQWQVTSNAAGHAIRRPGAQTDTVSAAVSNGAVSSVTKAGVTTTYQRTTAGNSATMTVTDIAGGQEPNPTTVVVSDLLLGRPVAVTDPLQNTTSFAYEAGTGRLQRVTAPEGNFTEYGYDTRGNVTLVRRREKGGNPAHDIVTSATYAQSCTNNPACNQPLTTTDARGQTSWYDYDPVHGGLLAVTGPIRSDGIRPQIRYGYSLVAGEYRLTSESQCQTAQAATSAGPAACAGFADEMRTEIGYNEHGEVTGITRTDGLHTPWRTAVTTMGYDALGNQTSVDGPLDGDIVHFRYNAARERIGTVSPDPDGGGPLPRRATRTLIDPATGLAAAVETGTLADPADWSGFQPMERVEAGYDVHFRPAWSKLVDPATGAAHAFSQTGYDALGRPECSALRMDMAAAAGPLTHPCLPDTRGARPHGPDRISRTLHDAAGRVREVQVAVGTPDMASEARYSYRPNGQVATLTDARDNVTAYSYDGHDRLSRTTYPAAAPHGATYEELFYESVGGGQFNSPLVASVRNRAGELIHLRYDALGQLVSKDVPNVRAYEVDVGYGYDNLGRLTSTADSLGHQQSFEYEVLGNLLAEHSNWYGSVRSQYDAAGRRWKLIWPDGFFVTYEHLVTGETAAIREYGSALLAGFGYDGLGRRTSLIRGNGTSTAYAYDPASRLAALTQELAGAGGDLALGLGYNPASQIVAENRSNELYAWKGKGNGTVASSINPLNQVESHGGATLVHDAKGNLTFDGTRTFAYTAENRLASGPGTNLYYDPLGRLVHLSGRGSNFHYDGADIIHESLPGGTIRRYVHGPGSDEPLVQYDGWGAKNWLHADERGSIVALSDAAGNVTAVNRYDEYGVPAQTNAGLFQYTGQVWLGELGIYSYKARMYQPSLGRFLQPDPIGYGDGMNMYAYVGGDPVNFVDSTGLAKEFSMPPPKCAGDACASIIVTGSRGRSGLTAAIYATALRQALGNGGVSSNDRTVGDRGAASWGSTPAGEDPSAPPVGGPDIMVYGNKPFTVAPITPYRWSHVHTPYPMRVPGSEAYRKQTRPPADYCGPAGGGGGLIPDSVGGVSISGACAVHDQCYSASSTTDRSVCDRQFRSNIISICSAGGGRQCNANAQAYWIGVRIGGQFLYLGRGKND